MQIKTLTYGNFSWLLLTKPGEEEMEFLRKNYPFHPLNLEDYLGKIQSPKIDKYRYYTLVVLDLPYFDAKEEKIKVAEVDFFLGDNYLVCLHDDDLPIISEIFSRCQKSKKALENFLGRGPAFCFYRLADLLVDLFFPVLDDLSAEIEVIDRDIWEAPEKAMVLEISLQRRNTVILQTMVKPTIPIFEKLEKGEVENLNKEMTNLWGNILDHLQKIWERLEDNRELIEGLAASNESLLSHKTNEIIRVLTVFSATLLPLTLLASIYGMNIRGLPLAEHPLSLGLIALLMLAVAFGMIFYFKVKRWL